MATFRGPPSFKAALHFSSMMSKAFPGDGLKSPFLSILPSFMRQSGWVSLSVLAVHDLGKESSP